MNKKADYIIKTLINNGFEAYYVGGSARNKLHNEIHHDNLPIKDYDIVTNASYDKIKELFEEVTDRGESFNVAIVKIDGEEFEVAQYRGEKYPEGGSTRPSEVYNVDNLKDDLIRRDFKMNGLVIDKDGNVIDLVDGLDDIKKKVISTIGDPQKRFSEDPLRIVRAIRFSSQLEYYIETKTLKAMIDNVHLLESIPHSRIKGEMDKVVKGKNPFIALLYLKVIHNLADEISYTNTFTGKKVKMFPSLCSFSVEDYREIVEKVNVETGTVGFYYSLYKYFSPEIVEEEFTDMQILTNKEIQQLKLLVANKEIAKNPTRENLLKLVRDIKGPKQHKTLMTYLKIYQEVDGADFSQLNDAFKRPLFIKDLVYDGDSVVQKGKRFGYDISGKYIGMVLEKGREQSVLGNTFNLPHIFILLDDILPKRKRT